MEKFDYDNHLLDAADRHMDEGSYAICDECKCEADECNEDRRVCEECEAKRCRKCGYIVARRFDLCTAHHWCYNCCYCEEA